MDLSEKEIRVKYLKAPSHDEIFGFISELGVSYSQFERYYSMPYGVIRQVKRHVRYLPVKYWPIIYERIVPQYGIPYMVATKLATQAKSKTPVAATKASVAHIPDSHTRLTTVK